MKIGILTFHWATNYGAVLQAYALQEFLRENGHDVWIIDYIPFTFKLRASFFIKHPSALFYIKDFFHKQRKDRKIELFRTAYLRRTIRISSYEELLSNNISFDVIISGSDQVLNPSFSLMGENKPTSSYFLGFAEENVLKIGYAVSFGCETYPSEASVYAKQWINNFDRLGVRENTGLYIVKELGYLKDAIVVPDPTLLMGSSLFDHIKLIHPIWHNYRCVYLLRKTISYKNDNDIVIDESSDSYTMEEWISVIKFSKGLITNSYHGMIMAILNHVPFVVILESGNDSGMNDRFISLLNRLGLSERICNNEKFDDVMNLQIDWNNVDKNILTFQNSGSKFLSL